MTPADDPVEVIDEVRYDVTRLVARFETVAAAAEFFEVNERTVGRWLADGVSWVWADRLCGQMKIHPCWVWDEWWDAEFAHEEEQTTLFAGVAPDVFVSTKEGECE